MRLIVLSQGFSTMVDDDSYEYLNQWKWSYAKKPTDNTGYAFRRVGNNRILMHRLILNLSGQIVKVDHMDGSGLNNQRSNLRVATHSQNMANRVKRKGSSLFLGVTWDKDYQKWRVQIRKDGVIKRIGRFDNEADAAKAYNAAAVSLHGEFAKLNEC